MTSRLILPLLFVLAGCSSLDNCPESLPDITIETGKSDAALQVYESAPIDGPLDHFPAKTKLRFKHDLGFTPAGVKAYLAFSKEGTNGPRGGSVAESAGNQSLIECWDSHTIVVRNDTCEEDFHIQVIAWNQSITDRGNDCSE